MPAHMIPPVPKEFDEASEEGFVFDVLKYGLSEDFYVFHSVSPTTVKDGALYEREIDFVIAHKELGVLCLEAKNSAYISYDSHYREWRYSSGAVMEHGGPYKQVDGAKRVLRDKIKNHANPAVRSLYDKCKVLHAVFFFKMTQAHFAELELQGLPEEADRNITLLADDIHSMESSIKSILSLQLPSDKYTYEDHKLSDTEFRLLLDSVLCPAFKLIPSPKAKGEAMEYTMNQLLNEQYRILEFIEDLDSAVINGAAGTGKTMIAAEKAGRHSENGERVLFLCYNRLLCDDLIRRYQTIDKQSKARFSNVDFMTISKLALEKTGCFDNYDGLLEWLYDCDGEPEKFGYKHIIVDEGQDFGLIDNELGVSKTQAESSCSIVDALHDVAMSCGGTFFLFYDKYQTIQGKDAEEYKLPDCIQDCDCRLTLKSNCRNTKEIAKTSVTPLRDKKNKAIKPAVVCSWFEPEVPVMHLVKDKEAAVEALGRVLDEYEKSEINDVVILTPLTEEYSCIGDALEQGKGNNASYSVYCYKGKRYRVTTCKKFKGLEANAIVMLDLSKESFVGKKGLGFYVGTSRAKQRLDLIASIPEEDYYTVVHELDPNAPKKSNIDRMRSILGSTFSARVVAEP